MDYDFRDGCNLAQVQLFQSIGKVAEQLFNTFACQNDDNERRRTTGDDNPKNSWNVVSGHWKKNTESPETLFRGGHRKKNSNPKMFF